jgi:integrase/recombinase XerC
MATFFMDINQDPIILKFLDYIKFEKRYSAHTFRAYSDDLMHFYGFLEMQFEVNQPNLITPAMIRSWMASLTLSKIQPRSINRKISSLKSFFKFCLVQGLIEVNPTKALQVLKTKKRLPSYIEQEQMDLLLNSTTFPDSFEGRTEYLSISMLYQTGIRVSELVNLKVTQIDRSAKQLKVLGKGNKERIIPLNKEMLKQVEVYLAERKLMFSDDSTLNLLVNSKGLPTNARKLYDVVKKYL